MGVKAAFFTKLLIVVMFTIAIGCDIYWAANGVEGDTISEVTRAYSWRWATIPLVYGVLTGHLFWNVRGEVIGRLFRVIVLGALGVGSIVLDILDYYDVMPLIPLVLGICLGRLLWPQIVPVKQALFVWKTGRKG